MNFLLVLLHNFCRGGRLYQASGFLCSVMLHIVVVLAMFWCFHNMTNVQDKLLRSDNKHITRNVSVYLYHNNRQHQREAMAHERAIISHRNFHDAITKVSAKENTVYTSQVKNVDLSASFVVMTNNKLLLILHDLIQQNVQYPHGALANSVKKTTVIGFNLYPDGHIDGTEIIDSSGMIILDIAAFDAVKTLPRVIVAEKLLRACQHFIVPVNFQRV